MFLSIVNFKKATAILVLNCFLFSFVYENAVAEVMRDIPNTPVFSNLNLNYGFGKITDSHITNSDRLIIQIQELHCHAEMQRNIAHLIEHIDTNLNGGLNAVYVEGAYGDVDTSWLKE